MKKSTFIIVLTMVVVAAAAGIYAYLRFVANAPSGVPAEGGATPAIRVVAAEDFYGNIASQVGGDKVSVTSIISNPNVDPHEYESTVADGVAVADADVVIENGLDYDTWMDKLIGASPSSDRMVITAGDIVPELLPENPHVWYSITDIEAVASATASAFIEKDPADAAEFTANLRAFDSSLQPVTDEMQEIKTEYAGMPVGLTETIYLYMTGAMGLDVLTPFDFEKAIAEGNDPSAASVATTDGQISGHAIKVLIYNSQTVTPVTTNLENAAEAAGIPVVPVTETMPAGDTYQSWMADELQSLAAALSQSGAGR